MAWNYQCGNCERKWPHSKAFNVCPVCRVRCITSTVGNPLTKDEIEREFRRRDFDKYYASREATRTGPSPEEVGRAEAQRIIDLDRAASEPVGTISETSSPRDAATSGGVTQGEGP